MNDGERRRSVRPGGVAETQCQRLQPRVQKESIRTLRHEATASTHTHTHGTVELTHTHSDANTEAIFETTVEK